MYIYHTPTPEEFLQKSVDALSDSVYAINKSIEECTHLETEHMVIKANVVHLERMLLQSEILERVSDESVFRTAIAAGKAHIA